MFKTLAKTEDKSPQKRKFWWNSDHGSFSKYAVVALAIAVLFMLFVSRNNIFRYLRARHTIAEQNAEMKDLRDKNAALEEQLDKVSSTEEKERYAREHFRFTAPGEDLYIIED